MSQETVATAPPPPPPQETSTPSNGEGTSSPTSSKPPGKKTSFTNKKKQQTPAGDQQQQQQQTTSSSTHTRREVSTSSAAGSTSTRPSNPQRTFQNLFVACLPKTLTNQELLSIFQPFGASSAAVMMDVNTGVSKGYGFATFNSEAEGKAALEALNHTTVKVGSHEFAITVSPSKHDSKSVVEESCFVYFRNIPSAFLESTIRDVLARHGKIVQLTMRQEPEKDMMLVMVEYSSVDEAKTAIDECHGQIMFPQMSSIPVMAKFADANVSKQVQQQNKRPSHPLPKRGEEGGDNNGGGTGNRRAGPRGGGQIKINPHRNSPNHLLNNNNNVPRHPPPQFPSNQQYPHHGGYMPQYPGSPPGHQQQQQQQQQYGEGAMMGGSGSGYTPAVPPPPHSGHRGGGGSAPIAIAGGARHSRENSTSNFDGEGSGRQGSGYIPQVPGGDGGGSDYYSHTPDRGSSYQQEHSYHSGGGGSSYNNNTNTLPSYSYGGGSVPVEGASMHSHHSHGHSYGHSYGGDAPSYNPAVPGGASVGHSANFDREESNGVILNGQSVGGTGGSPHHGPNSCGSSFNAGQNVPQGATFRHDPYSSQGYSISSDH